MNPTRPSAPPHLTRTYSSEAMQSPFYGMHVNAAVAGPSTQRSHPLPRSNSSPTSFYPPHLAQHSRAPQPPPLPSKPASLISSVPLSLVPGRGSVGRSRAGLLSSLESSLFFQSGPAPPSDSFVYSKPHSYSQNASPSRPPLPPKPRVQSVPMHDGSAPNLLPKPFASSKQQTTTPSPAPVSLDEDELVARALELSLKESTPTPSANLEDDILARALEESLASNGSSATHDTRSCQNMLNMSSLKRFQIGSNSDVPSASSSFASCTSQSFDETPATSAHSHSSDPDDVGHEELQHTYIDTNLGDLARQELKRMRDEDDARRKQLEMDEEFARSIALLEAENASIASGPSPTSASASFAVLSSSLDNVSRSKHNGKSSSARPISSYAAQSASQPAPSTSCSPLLRPPVATNTRPHSVSISSFNINGGPGERSIGTPPNPMAPPHYQLGRSVSAQASVPSVSESPSSAACCRLTRPNDVRPNSAAPVQRRRDSGASETSPSTPRGRPEAREGTRSTLSTGVGSGSLPPDALEENEAELSPTSPTSTDERDEGRLMTYSPSPPIIEEELLLGVSFGFNVPPLAAVNQPMQDPIPNIITLPYGKAPPLHIHAPSWKHLLKLLARLSDSRIEPTVEALAGTKSELKLRTVIQFMKVQYLSDDWRAIVYLTIDVPVPPSTPNMHKYTNGDVNTLPYSYTMSPLPVLLRAGAGDSDVSKCFTVPATPNTPYPTLPMTLPDFALYLHAILEESRRAVNDSSGGLRKLAKIVDTLYPAESLEGLGPEMDVPDKRSVGKFFRRALGRGNRESQVQRGGNAERYEFITPFRIDEYR